MDGGVLDPGGLGETQARADAGSADRPAGQPDPIREGGVRPSLDRSGAEVSAKVSAVGCPRSEGLDQPQGSGNGGGGRPASVGIARSAPTGDRLSASSIQAEPSMSLVRNPLSSEFRDFSLSGPTAPVQGGPVPDQGGMGRGPVDLTSGASSSPQGGTSIDLSRTNELLQQLIDAVRKQRGSSLPPGGPSVYPDR